jgi:hypothetical protein
VIAATSIADPRALAGRELGASDWAEFLIRVFEKED